MKNKDVRTRIFSLVLFCVLLFAGNICFNHSYKSIFIKTKSLAENSEKEVCGTVTDDISTLPDGSDFVIKTDNNIKISVSYSGINEIFPGDKVRVKKPELTYLNKDNILSSINKSMLGNKIAAALECDDDSIEIIGIDKGFSLQRFFYKVRKSTFYNLLRFLSYDEAAFVYSVVSSDKSYLSNELYEKFVNSGILHLCTVSGFHFAFLCMFITIVTLVFTGKYRIRIFISLMIATLFLLYTGFDVSVLRAYIMFFAVKICDLMYIDKPGSRKIFLMILCIFMIENPLIIYNTSFLLSFSAIAGLLFFYPEFSVLFNARDSKIKNYLALSLGVNIFMITIGYSLFGYVTPWSFISNVLVEFPVGGLMVLVLAISAAGSLFVPLAYFLAPVLKLCINYIFTIVNLINLFPKMKVSFPLSMMTVVCFIGFSLFLIRFFVKRKLKMKSRGLSIAFCVCILMTGIFYFSQYRDDNAYITYIGDKLTVDISNKHKHYVIGTFEDLFYNSYNSSLKQNEVIEVLVINDSDIEISDFEKFINSYAVKNVVVKPELKEKLKKFQDDINIYDDIKYKDSFITLSYDGNTEFYIKNKRFIIADDMRYIAYEAQKEKDCTIIFSDYGNKKYRELIKMLEFPKSVNMIIHSEGYEGIECTDSYSLITVPESGNIKIN